MLGIRHVRLGAPKEYLLVREGTAPTCVFQTFAHPTPLLALSAVYSYSMTLTTGYLTV